MEALGRGDGLVHVPCAGDEDVIGQREGWRVRVPVAPDDLHAHLVSQLVGADLLDAATDDEEPPNSVSRCHPKSIPPLALIV